MKPCHRKRYRKTGKGLAFVVGLAVATPVPAAVLEEVVVTARKRVESTQEIATSITTFTGDQAVSLGIKRSSDLAKLTPGLNAKYSVGLESPIFTMRGIGLNDYSSINNPSVGVYVDDIFLPFIPMMNSQLYDIERIEILKGPQGTLYGRNTTGGAIKFISRKPTAERDFRARLDYGSWETVELEAAGGGALTDTLNIRVAGLMRQRDSGYQYNRLTNERVGNQDRLAGRVILDWSPSEIFNAELNLHAGRDESDAALREHVGFTDPVTGVTPCPAVLAGMRGDENGNCVDTTGYADNDNDPYASDINNHFGNDVSSRSHGGSLLLNWTLPRSTLVSVTGYDEFTQDLVDDTDAAPTTQFETIRREEVDVFQQELRLVSDDSWGFDWLVGLFYSDDQIRSVNTQAVDELYGSVVSVSNDQTTTSYALFANVEWPFAERWSLTGGIRLTTEEKRRHTVSEDLNPYGTSVLNPTDGPFVFVVDDTTIDDDDVSGNIGLTYHPTDDVMVYASASRGFKSGGFKGNISFNAFQVGPYDPEELFAYEIGFKSMLFGNSLMLNAATYYYDWRDFQAYSLVQLEIPVVVLTNAGDAEVKGVEAELMWQPTENLELGAGFNWMNGEIVEFEALEGGQDNTGKQLSNAPDRSFSAIGKYNFSGISEKFDPYIQATATYQSKVFFEIQNNPVNSESGYWLANLQVGFTAKDEKWDVALWARNLFDKAYIAEARYVDLRVFPNANTYGEPRSVGISVNYRY